jgi:hypothetical protein
LRRKRLELRDTERTRICKVITKKNFRKLYSSPLIFVAEYQATNDVGRMQKKKGNLKLKKFYSFCQPERPLSYNKPE